MKIALIGTGNMGEMVAVLARRRGHEITASVDELQRDLGATELASFLSGNEVAIDFSGARAVERNVEACMIAGVPLVEGTTGWNDQLDEVRTAVERYNGALVYGANFSIGVNLFYRVTEFAAEIFSRFPEYEVFIEEQHHSRKKDAPSGTALKLEMIVSQQVQREISISSTRAGNIPGTHRVGFDGPADQVLLEHTARSREGFAAGSIRAAEWIVNKKGFFEFGEVMDEILS